MYYARLSQIVLPVTPANWFDLVLYSLALLLLIIKVYKFVTAQDKSKYYNYYLGSPPSAKPGGLGATVVFAILALTSVFVQLQGWAIPIVLLVGYTLKLLMVLLLVDMIMFAGTFLTKNIKESLHI